MAIHNCKKATKEWIGTEWSGLEWTGKDWKGVEKNMKKYKVTIKGTAPLIQNKIPDDMELTEKKGEGKDTPESCEKKLYLLNKKIHQPAIHIENALTRIAGGIKQKGAGKKSYKDLFKGAVFVKPDYIPHLKQKWEPLKTTVVIPSTKGRITRYRPVLKEWALEFEIEILDDRITENILKLALDEAGRTNGLGDFRPRYGRFIVEEFKEI